MLGKVAVQGAACANELRGGLLNLSACVYKALNVKARIVRLAYLSEVKRKTGADIGGHASVFKHVGYFLEVFFRHGAEPFFYYVLIIAKILLNVKRFLNFLEPFLMIVVYCLFLSRYGNKPATGGTLA